MGRVLGFQHSFRRLGVVCHEPDHALALFTRIRFERDDVHTAVREGPTELARRKANSTYTAGYDDND